MPSLALEPLPVPRTTPPRTAAGRWFQGGPRLDQPHPKGHSAPWYRVLWLTGVDYFSTLGYQPGIALLAAGALSPVATALLVAVTLLGALPVYSQVARRSYAGQGSIAMLENQLPGWVAKVAVLVLLGFAGTDFVVTMTLSAADAVRHAEENPFLRDLLSGREVWLTLAFLAVLAAVFLRGFREAIGIAAAIAIPYLLLNAVVLARSAWEIARHPEVWSRWTLDLRGHGDVAGLLLAAALVFPRLALGLSGFETGVAVMPLVSARGGEHGGRVRATRKLLATAALLMSLLLAASSLATTLLVPREAYAAGGEAAGRAIAFLAHRLLGHGFGSVYDAATVAILWFAGASAMAGLLSLVPRYLPRFGMAPRWTIHARPLVLVFFAIDAAVTVVFQADVEAQAGAYATGVLALILSAAVAVALAFWNESRAPGPGPSRLRRRLASLSFWAVSAVFAFTLVDNVLGRPDGLVIALLFVAAILTLGALSRWRRSTELRVADVVLDDETSASIWPEITGRKVNLVPLRTATAAHRDRKARELRRHYRVEGPIAFLHVTLVDNRSEFLASLRVRVRRVGEDYVVEVSGAVAIANTVAYLSELVDPRSLFLGLTRRNLMGQSLRYLLWGEGETGLLVYSILLRYWEWTPEPDVRPLIFLMSE